jgi:hypothetical protein
MRKHTIAALAAPAVILLALACGGTPEENSAGATQNDTPAGTNTLASAAPAKSAAPAGPIIAFKDGTYEVGTAAGQVKPGKYKTTVPADSRGCYWERQKALGGGLADVIANDNVPAGAPTVVVIAATDKGFKSERCGEWKLS